MDDAGKIMINVVKQFDHSIEQMDDQQFDLYCAYVDMTFNHVDQHIVDYIDFYQDVINKIAEVL